MEWEGLKVWLLISWRRVRVQRGEQRESVINARLEEVIYIMIVWMKWMVIVVLVVI